MNANTREQIQLSEPVCHVIKGELVTGRDVEYGPASARFATPKLELDSLTWSRLTPGPAFETPVAEIIDLLVETGEALTKDADGLVAEAYQHMLKTSPMEQGVLKRAYDDLGKLFNRHSMEVMIQSELGGPEVLDGYKEVVTAKGQRARVRAYPPRIVHILAGNVPGVAAISVVRGALVKGVNLFKLPSNDLYSATAILRTMANVAPGHPVVRSFSAVYWRGGDDSVEGRVFRPQYFDKLVAWGGDAALRSAKKYIGPGFELVAFDPKTSLSFIGREAFRSKETLAEAAMLAAIDATPYNQAACISSRMQFIEGELEDVDRFCEALQRELGVERHTCSEFGPKVPSELKEEIEVLGSLEPEYRVWGGYEGRGLVIRSDEPVDFYPDGKIVNVVRVKSLLDAVKYAGVASSTVGVYPPERKVEVRDLLASAGVQRIVSLGRALGPDHGISHDGFYPLQRFVRWVNDED